MKTHSVDSHRHRMTTDSHRHRMATVVWIAVMALLIVVPGVHFAQLTVFKPPAHYPAVVPQISVTGSTPPKDLIARLRSLPYVPHYPPVVITFHNIDVKGEEYTVTPQAFAADMRLLHEAGWTTLTAAQFEAWQHGSRLPPHSFLLTFDDGALGVYRYADPVLRQYNMHGIAFIITGWVGTHHPYYMTWRELELLQADHHWDIEAHTHLGHGFVVSNAAGTLKPFLDTTMWLPRQHRVETLAEYRTRVRSDLQQCIADLVDHGFPRPHLFAYPFSAVGDNAVGAALYSIVHSMFDAAFLDSSAGVPTQLKEELSHEFRRVDVIRRTSENQFVQNIENSTQRATYALTATSWRTGNWVSTTGASIKLPATSPVPLSVVLTGNSYAEMHLNPYYTSFWTNYQVRATFSGLKDGVGASLFTLTGSNDELEAAVTSSGYSLYRGEANTSMLESGQLATSGPTHQVEMTVRPGSVVVRIDGQLLTTVKTNQASRGGITIGGDPQRGVPQLDSVSVTPLPSAALSERS
jgi:poly-beta-1,6-N-acetyl-D-glucosamine N-deacetylase